MTITLNGAAAIVPDDTTLADLMAGVSREAARGSAAAVDGEVVPRAMWDAFSLREGAIVEVITAVQGG